MGRALAWSAAATLIKMGLGLLVVKWMAHAFGPDGMGRAGNFIALVTLLGVLSGAGIYNGVTKYVSEFQHDPVRLRRLLGTSSIIVFGFSCVLALLFILAAAPLSQLLFDRDDLRSVVWAIAFIQFGIAYANFFLAILKGQCDARGNALSVIAGSLLGLGVCWLAFRLGDYASALIGLALAPALLVLPAAVMLFKRGIVSLKPIWDSTLARGLCKFTAMATITAIMLPLAYTMMRELLAARHGWDEVGLWQGVSQISLAYLQFITAPFTVYLLPMLARQKNKIGLAREIGRAQCFLLPLALVMSLSIWLLRDIVIELLFSTDFKPMRDLFAWQLSGDVFKVSAYMFAYLVIARASLCFCVLTEISQFGLLTFFSRCLIPSGGALGAVQAYAATYMVYFALCATAFLIYCKKGR